MSYGYAPLWQKDALELLDRMRKFDDDISVTMPELRRTTGWPKSKLETVLAWLTQTGGFVRVDDEHFRRWRAVRDEDEGDVEETTPADVPIFDDHSEDILRELQAEV